MNEREKADLERGRRSRLLEGLRETGKVLDNARAYAGQDRELKGIAERIKRIEGGHERV